jgi:hypothetical protein
VRELLRTKIGLRPVRGDPSRPAPAPIGTAEPELDAAPNEVAATSVPSLTP